MNISPPPYVKKIIHKEFASIYIYKNSQDVGLAGAITVIELINANSRAHICCSTGITPQPMYQTLVSLYRKQFFDPVHALWSHLDERAGIAPDDPDSYASEMATHLWDKLNITHKNRYIICGNQNPEEEIERLRAFLAANPRDLTLLGLGIDDHIAYNMPGDPLLARAHFVKKLTGHVIQRDFERTGRKFVSAITMGVEDIVDSNHILMLATGKEKAAAVGRMLTYPISPKTPSTYIRKGKDTHVYLDADAAALL